MCRSLKWPSSWASTASISGGARAWQRLSKSTMRLRRPSPEKYALACDDRREPSITKMPLLEKPVRYIGSLGTAAPLHVAHAGPPVLHPREGEEQVGEAVHVAERDIAQLVLPIQGHEPALRSAADGPRDVEGGGGRRAAGQDEALQGLELLFEAIDSSGFASLVKSNGGVFAAVQAVHLTAMAILGGMLIVTDLRLLNVLLREVPADNVVDASRKWIRYALIAMMISGVYMSFAVAIKLYFNFFFWTKMTALGVGLLFLYAIKSPLLGRGVAQVGPWTVKLVALASLMLWFTVAASGRWIGFS